MTEVSPAILALGTAVPAHQVAQAALCDWMAEAVGAQPALARWLRALYRASGIETRHSVLDDDARPPVESRFAPSRPAHETPSTDERMAIYEREAPVLAGRAARRALAELATSAGTSVEVAAASVTHLIAVSCTGFFAPGLDIAVARRLGLAPSVERTMVGFMGCAAAFNALRLAAQIVRSRPDARVLVVCAELCSIHAQPARDRVNLTVTSLFADGAAACLVGAPEGPGQERLNLDAFHTTLVPDPEGELMAWRIGDHGFRMRLSPEIPKLLGQVAPQAVATLLDGRPRPRRYAIHPGGRGIVDQVQAALGLSEEQARPSREVLRRYGNMSSPTILFVLHELREAMRAEAGGDVEAAVAMAFGPGLVAEMAHLTYVPALERIPAGSRQPAGESAAQLRHASKQLDNLAVAGRRSQER